MLSWPARDEIVQRHLGLPPHVLSSSALGSKGLAEVVDALRLAPGDTFLDLACGRGGYGLEIAARTGTRLVGVDFSAEAVRQAREQARRLGQEAEFRVGELTAIGLAAGSVDAVLCVDAIQFADPADAAYDEMNRVLVPGGRVVLTCWEPVDRDAGQLPEALRAVNLHAGLTAAGFDQVDIRDRPDWRAAEHALWQEAAAHDPGDDPSLGALHDEAVRTLAIFHLMKRVMATATVPRVMHAG